jgi:cyclomaltodextrinase
MGLAPRSIVAWLAACSLLPAMTDADPAREPARPSPSWVRDAVVYEVFPRAFSPGGDFAGITARLDDLQKLGVTVLWLTPIHPIGKEMRKGSVGSPYAVSDFYGINPDYGTAEDLKRLVAAAHARGLRVVTDVVVNHTSWDSVMMKTPAFYVRDAEGRIQPPNEKWTDVAKLDYGNPALRTYITDMLRYWLREFGLDGYRCDVAGLVPTDFWEAVRPALEAIKPDLLLLAEWSAPELLVKAFDVDYAWPLHRALNEVLFGMKPASALRTTWLEEKAKFPKGSLHLHFSDNHDERRAIARFGERAALAASAFAFTLDGVPLLYNGMEVGDTTESGGPALNERLPIFWPMAERRPEFVRFYPQMIALRRAHPALRQGELAWISNSDEARVLSYARRAEGEEFVVAINMSGVPFVGRIDLARPGGFEDVTPEASPPLLPGESASTPRPRPPVALPELSLDAWGFRIFRRAPY